MKSSRRIITLSYFKRNSLVENATNQRNQNHGIMPNATEGNTAVGCANCLRVLMKTFVVESQFLKQKN